MDILRFITAGSVDDGKSTLIGRLLYDSKSVLIDQLETIRSTEKGNGRDFDFSRLTDGLRAEREQGITIDVAYKYFSTPRRKFIIADSPGHLQYTRNMITGASNSDLAIIIVDVLKGINEQTKRHSIIASLLGINNLVICINKMDLVKYDEAVFNALVTEFQIFSNKLSVNNIFFIPISALAGDNVVSKSSCTNWYGGPPLLSYLEEVKISSGVNITHARFPVQYVIRPTDTRLNGYRGYAGKIISGIFKEGDQIISYPSGSASEIKKIELYGNDVAEAFAPMSVTIYLKDDIDISRGDLLSNANHPPVSSTEFEALLCWMDNRPLNRGNKYLLQHNSKIVKCAIQEILYELDVNSLGESGKTEQINLNGICRVRIKTAAPVCFDLFSENKANGRFILVDENSNATAAAGMISGCRLPDNKSPKINYEI